MLYRLCVGDRIWLPASLASPKGEYVIVAFVGDLLKLRSAKDNIVRYVHEDTLTGT